MKKIIKPMRNYISGILGEEFPVSRMIGKNLAKGHLLPHWELLEKYDAKGRDGFDWRTTQYYQRMVNPEYHLSSNFSAIPDGLMYEPQWWAMPWAIFIGKNRRGKVNPEERAFQKINDFFDMFDSIKKDGYKATRGGAINGYRLVHPEYGSVFNHIDGHHRTVVLTFLGDRYGWKDQTIKVRVLKTVRRSEIESTPQYAEGLEKNYFDRDGAYKLFDFCFTQLDIT